MRHYTAALSWGGVEFALNVLLYRPNVDLRSGTGQLMQMQAAGLQAGGARVRVGCTHGGIGFFLRTGVGTRHLPAAGVGRHAHRPGWLVVDNSMLVPDAQVVFVHNLVTEANEHLQDEELLVHVADEARFFAALREDALLVANSRLVAAALGRRFALPAERIVVHYPGIRSARFAPEQRQRLRGQARRRLGIPDDAPVAGFITSGDLHKRGLDLFVDCARRLLEERPALHFLVVGSKRWPAHLGGSDLLAAGRLHHVPKNLHPELWMSALDLFLYPARFEEFGMVVLEAMALGIPVVTSRRVGAAECLPPAYDGLLCPEPDPVALAETASRVLADPMLAARLAAAGSSAARDCSDERYARETAATILACPPAGR